MATSIFARHETFHPRYGWLKKGFDAAATDPEIFVHPDAHVTLGVGKNMVRAIRYWCHAFKVLEDGPALHGRASASQPTAFGQRLLGGEGLDPYLEDLGSLWLLHWQLLRDPCFATAWWYAFFINARPEVSIADLTSGLVEYVKRHFPTARAAESSLRKDASCVVRMYGELPTGSSVSEESIHCPFAELGLIRPGAHPKSYAFRMGPKPGLSSALIAAACLEYAAERGTSGAQTVSLVRLLHEPGSPGLAFKLTESVLYAALEETVSVEPSLSLSDTAGMIQLSFVEPAAELSRRLVLTHYRDFARLEAVA